MTMPYGVYRDDGDDDDDGDNDDNGDDGDNDNNKVKTTRIKMIGAVKQ